MKLDPASLLSMLSASVARSATLLLQFIVVILLGTLAGLLILLPWILRLLALLAWLAGTYWTWRTIHFLYGSFTPALPLFALAAVPVILAIALVMWWLMQEEQGRMFGTMTLWGALGWMTDWGAPRLQAWTHGNLIIHLLPAVVSVSLLIFMTVRWGRVIRARRSPSRYQHPGSDRLTNSQDPTLQKEGAPAEISSSS